jgi:hypothetical protein
MIGDPKLMINAGKYSAGQGRTTARWAYAPRPEGNKQAKLKCPWCNKTVTPCPHSIKPKRKKVELSVLLCPKCEEVWQFRGPLSEEAQCPSCKHKYNPKTGNLPDKGKFRCSCGNDGKIIDSIRTLPEDQLLPMHPYGIEGYCPTCDRPDGSEDKTDPSTDLFAENPPRRVTPGKPICDVQVNSDSLIWKNNGKYFARVTPVDFARYQKAVELWEKHKATLPYPKSKISRGQETMRLLEHHYLYWHQMFNPRQLLALATLLRSIDVESNQVMKESLLSAFYSTLESNNVFCRYTIAGGNKSQGLFSRHDFQIKSTSTENNPYGLLYGHSTFINNWDKVIKGKEFAKRAYDLRDHFKVYTDPLLSVASLTCQSSATAKLLQTHYCVTDPPYAGNVNYSELSDFFYVWLRLSLARHYNWFSPDTTPKSEEIIENRTRGKSQKDFEDGLTRVFSNVCSVLDHNGIMIFTFHHAEGSAWVSLLQAICDAGFEIISIYPIQSEGESSLNLMDKQAISYDLIHVCKTRTNGNSTTRSWASVRQAIRQRARAEIKSIEDGRYGNDPLSPMDRNLVLIGKCLELYSEHYGRIVDHQNQPVPLHAALEEIRMMVDQLTTAESALPPELEEIDPPSYVYLTCLCDRKEIKSDEVSKATKGITEPSTLMDRDLMIKGRAKRGRTYEVKSPTERLDMLKKKFGVEQVDAQGTLFDEDLTTVVVPGVIFIDYVHFLIGLAETGESVLEWLDKFRGKRPQIRAALEYLAKRNRTFLEPVRKIMGLIDEKTLFSAKEDKHA